MNNQPIEFYIESGRKNRMYTLRRNNTNDNPFAPDSFYVRNLSNDPEKAEKKALEFVNRLPNAILLGGADFPLGSWGKKGNIEQFYGTFDFGKYAGQPVDKVFANDPQYVAFIFQSNIKQIPEKVLYHDEVLFESVVAYIQKEYVERVKKEKEIEEKKLISQYVGKVKDKVELEVTLLFKANFESYYSSMQVYGFKDKDGNQFVWLTSSSLYGQTGVEYNKGDSLTIKATIKAHDEYKGTKQTKLTRVKVV